MARSYRFAASPGWLAGHLLVLATMVTMVLLGRWQLDVSNSKGFSLQNFGYALQWWAFAAFGGGLWLKVLRDNGAQLATPSGSVDVATGASAAPAAASPPGPPQLTYRRYVMPESASEPDLPADPLHAEYNDYLAALAAQDAAEQRGQ